MLPRARRRRPRRCSAALLVPLLITGCVATGPEPLRVARAPDPVYPASARAEGVEGVVEVEYDLDSEGRLRNIEVIRSEPPGVFDAAVLEAVAGWRYEPLAAPRSRVRSTFDFRLDPEGAADYP